ncbi:MAG: hypothetical protein IT366_06505 [Candidatus Hydrogenedentes bacterium]|nr:hypothetical protein [Candidatus Hydrogenedentota bacterium]
MKPTKQLIPRKSRPAMAGLGFDAGWFSFLSNLGLRLNDIVAILLKFFPNFFARWQ